MTAKPGLSPLSLVVAILVVSATAAGSFALQIDTVLAQQPAVQIAALPATFDLRKISGVTPIKKQMGGTCWAFATAAAVESNLLVSGRWKALGMQGLPKCAEFHFDWWNGFNKHHNPDLANPGQSATGLTVHQGGNYRVAAAYLGRGDGIVLLPDGVEHGAWYQQTPKDNDPTYKKLYVRDIEFFTMDDNLGGIDVIKRQIMEHGAMGTANRFAMNNKDNIHYQPINSIAEANHATAIIGWDDNKYYNQLPAVADLGNTRAPRAGAWLIKNSHGDKAGEDGYYWISYYDKHSARHPEMGAVTFRNVELMPYQRFYHYDVHGWCDTLPKVSEAFNAFKATEQEKIRAVSFYTAVHDVRFTLKIFAKFDGTKLTAELASQKGQIQYSGFHTVDLQWPVDVKANDNFYVYVELSAGGHAIDRTSRVYPLLADHQQAVQPAQQPKKASGVGPIVISKANCGESFYHDGKRWLDLYDYKFANPDWATFDQTANFCMKALTVSSR